jgi:hypothetical protein
MSDRVKDMAAGKSWEVVHRWNSAFMKKRNAIEAPR